MEKLQFILRKKPLITIIKDTPVEAVWAKGQQWLKGKYTVEIYHNGTLIGKSTLN